MESTMREYSPDPAHWDKAIGLIQASFHKGHLIEECTWDTVVLIPKGGSDFLGIRLVGVIWKTVAGI